MDEERKEGEGQMEEEEKEQQREQEPVIGGKEEAGEFDPSDPLNSFIEVWKGVILTPVDFFKAMPKSGGYGNPTIFAVITFIIYGIGIALVTFGKGFAGIIGTPVGGIIGLFIGAAILWVCAKIVGGKGDYEATYRVLAYVTATNVVGWIPVVGWLASLYGIYLTVVGISESHEMSQGKALVAVLIPIVILIVIGTIAALVMGSFIASMVPRGGGFPR